METASSAGSLRGFGAAFKRSATATATPIAAAIPPTANSMPRGRRSRSNCSSSGCRLELARASSRISSKRDREESGGKWSDLACVASDRGAASLRTGRGSWSRASSGLWGTECSSERMKLTCNTPRDARIASEYSCYSGLFSMAAILASQSRRVISKSLPFTGYNKTAGEDFHRLFRLELHTSITVSGARSETFAVFTLGIGLKSSYLAPYPG